MRKEQGSESPKENYKLGKTAENAVHESFLHGRKTEDRIKGLLK